MIIKTIQLFLISTLNVHLFQSYIVRHLGCRYQANYTLVESGKYRSNRNITSIESFSIGDCSMRCTLNVSCVSFNHNGVTGACELIREHGGQIMVCQDWTFVSPDYGMDWRYRGAICQMLKPTDCNYEVEYCIDSCKEEKKYKCVGLKNVALEKPVTASSTWKDWYPARLTDGQIDTIYASNKHMRNWVKIDLLATHLIHFMVFHNRLNQKVPNSKYLTFRIGNSSTLEQSEICAKALDLVDIDVKKILCLPNCSMIGRYIFVEHTRTPRDGPAYFNFNQLIVYGE